MPKLRKQKMLSHKIICTKMKCTFTGKVLNNYLHSIIYYINVSMLDTEVTCQCTSSIKIEPETSNTNNLLLEIITNTKRAHSWYYFFN